MGKKTEKEVKFEVEQFSSLRKLLRKQGGQFIEKYLEKNIVLDTPSRKLISENKLLRLRKKGEKKVLCFKKPLKDALPGIKVLEEYETEVMDLNVTEKILMELGYGRISLYEKIREKWKVRGFKVCLDYLPFGKYVEIEGEGDLLGFIVELGIEGKGPLRESYHEINRKKREEMGLPPKDSFVFEEWKEFLSLQR